MNEPLANNSSILHYRIVSKIGAGGMGEVYLAEDTRLGRRVALKFLHAHFVQHQESVRRFEQEARAVSALNHPNILTIYETGEESGAHYIATEFVEGETLRARLKNGKLDLSETVDIAAQIAAALSAAHQAGIIHRDIKPENIMIRRDHVVKILDFGLVKLIDMERKFNVDLEASTQHNVYTTPGMMLGTTPYMSPEQARGLDVDARSDIFSFGSVLYEMLTGVMPFKGVTKTDTVIAVVQQEPLPLASYGVEIPNELQRIVMKALRKERDERYQTIRDLLLDLKSLREDLRLQRLVQSKGHITSGKFPFISTDGATAITQTDITRSESLATKHAAKHGFARFASPKVLLPVLGVLLLVASGVFVWKRQRENAAGEDAHSSLATIQLVSWKSDLGDIDSRGKFSRDGKFVAYASSKDGSLDIWIKQVSGGEPFVVPGTRDEWRDYSPVWSPDGQQIAFLSDRSNQFGVWTIPFLGGTPTLVKTVPRGSELVAWARNATIYHTADDNLFALDLNTKQSVQVTQFDVSQRLTRHFSLSPDEESIAYEDKKNGQRDIWTMPLHRGDAPAVRVTNDATEKHDPLWMPDGKRILYNADRNGVAQIYVAYTDGRQPVQVTFNDNNNELYDVSPDGTKILYLSAKDEADIWGVKLDTHKEFQITSEVGVELWADAAPDGKHIAFQSKPVQYANAKIFDCTLYVAPLIGNESRLKLFDEGFYPQWSPDGERVAFLRADKGLPNLWVIQATGGEAKQLTTHGVMFGGFSRLPFNRLQTRDYEWSPDNQRIAYCANKDGTSNVSTIAVDGAGETQITRNADANAQFFNPLWSPDGKRLAYLSRRNIFAETGTISWEVFVDAEGETHKIFQSDSVLRLVGWDSAGQNLLVKSVEGKKDASQVTLPAEVLLLKVSVANGATQTIARLRATYFSNLHLAPDGKSVAFVMREENADTLRVMSVNGGESRKLNSTGDQYIYLSGMSWSPDGKTIFYSKQANWRTLFMIDNFK